MVDFIRPPSAARTVLHRGPGADAPAGRCPGVGTEL